MTYQSLLNRIALSVLIKPICIPDHRLMIGSAEKLNSMDLLIPQATVSKQVAENMSKLNQYSDEELLNAINNQTLEIDDLNGNVSLIGGAY